MPKQKPTTSPSNYGAVLKAFVERVERMETEIKESQEAKSEVYKEAKAAGIEMKPFRAVIRARRTAPDEWWDEQKLIDHYFSILGDPRSGELTPFEKRDTTMSEASVKAPRAMPEPEEEFQRKANEIPPELRRV